FRPDFFNEPVVHWYRNIFSHVPSTKVREVAATLKAIHVSEDLAAAREKANRVIDKLRGLRLSRAAELVETAGEEKLTYYAFPEGRPPREVAPAAHPWIPAAHPWMKSKFFRVSIVGRRHFTTFFGSRIEI